VVNCYSTWMGWQLSSKEVFVKMKEIAIAADEVDLKDPDDVRRHALDLMLREIPWPWDVEWAALQYDAIVKLLEGADQ